MKTGEARGNWFIANPVDQNLSGKAASLRSGAGTQSCLLSTGWG
jgi:hypothetical protein